MASFSAELGLYVNTTVPYSAFSCMMRFRAAWFMPEYLSQPDTYFILLSICGSLSLLVTSLIAFRFLAIAISIGYLFVIFWVGLDQVGMTAQLGTSLLGIGLNGVMIARYFYARSMASLAYTWRSVYVQNFSLMLPYEFDRLVNHAQVRRFGSIDTPEFVQKSNQNFSSLMFVLDGAAMVDIEGDRVAKLYPGDWISEESFLTGETTKDDVLVKNATLLVWDADELARLKEKNPSIYEKLNLIISRNLCHKLIRAYGDEHRLMHQND